MRKTWPLFENLQYCNFIFFKKSEPHNSKLSQKKPKILCWNWNNVHIDDNGQDDCFLTVAHLQCDYVIWLLSTVQNITATCSVSVSQRGTEGQKQCLSIVHKDGEVFKCSPQKCIVRHLKELQRLHTPKSLLLDHAHDGEWKGSIPLFSTGGLSECLASFSPGYSLSRRMASHTVPLLCPCPRARLHAFLLRLFGHIR